MVLLMVAAELLLRQHTGLSSITSSERHEAKDQHDIAIAAFRPAVDAFFDKVLVNAPDPAVRANRLTLLNKLFTEFSTVADFSEIVTSGEQK